LKAPDQLVGKSVKCPGCGAAVLVKAVADAPSSAPRPAPAKAQAAAPAPVKKKPPVEEVIDDLDEADEDDAPPPKKNAIVNKKPVKKPVDDDLEDLDEVDEDDAPRSKKKGRVEEDDDDDDDAPKKKKGKLKKGGGSEGGPTTEEDRNNAFMFYIALLVGSFLGFGPLGGLVWWFMKRGESRFVDWVGRQWLNHTLTFFVYIFGSIILFGGLAFAGGNFAHWSLGLIFGGLAALIAIGMSIFSFICTIMAMFKAKSGEWYVYPLSWRVFG